MTSEEVNARMDRLTERHEVLTRSFEVGEISQRKTERMIRRLATGQKALTGSLKLLVHQIADLTIIVKTHERRFEDLDQGGQ